ncbi:MAG: hypothetical protein Q8909_09520 [Bacteroidota bacterium]|nr:hypothetical protein [Bacteroidota bacterium]
MKTIFIILLTVFCFTRIFAQKEKTGIDPRQFITIKELNRQTNHTSTIYNNQQGTTVQTLDNNSLLTIIFDHDSISKKSCYYGNISIISQINNEQIKVSPYSKVGEKQGTIGINSASPMEIAINLHSLIEHSNQINRLINNIFNDDFYSSNFLFRKRSSKNQISQTKQIITNKSDTIFGLYYLTNSLISKKKASNNQIFNISKSDSLTKKNLEYYSIISPELFQSINDTASNQNNYDTLINSIVNLNKKLSDKSSIEYKSLCFEKIIDLKKLKRELDITKKYLLFFSTGSPELRNLYSTLLKQDNLSTNKFLETLSNALNTLQPCDTISLVNFKEYSNIVYSDLVVLNYPLQLFLDLANKSSFKVDKINEDFKLDSVAVLVGHKIYSKLFDGTIDLRESRAKEGDILEICLLYYPNKDSITTPLQLEVATFNIKEIGWRLKVSDSFLLINRISEPNNKTTVSPSRFKGAPGISLLWTYGNNGFKNNIFKRLEPSLGINVSYLDFDSTKDLEIGAGAIAGFFRNQIFITAGYNLHTDNKGFYWGVGFSFANIANQIKK